MKKKVLKTKKKKAASKKVTHKKASQKKAIKKTAPKKTSKPQLKELLSSKVNKIIKKSGKDLRVHKRVSTSGLWVTERNGDFQYVLEASNLSQGGMFLLGRAKSGHPTSQLIVPLKSGQKLTLTARVIHDLPTSNSIGVGFEFIDLSNEQNAALKSLLRDLN